MRDFPVTSGKDIDYFNILKERLDKYVFVLQKNSEVQSGTSSIIGSTFAEICNADDNAVAILTGTKMFTLTLGSVKEYLDAVEIIKKKEENNEN